MSDRLKVLVVHRQKLTADEIRNQFDAAGWLVHLAHSGLDGLLAARKEEYTLIVTAVDLPVITGIEMVRTIRNFSMNVQTSIVFMDLHKKDNYDSLLEKLSASTGIPGKIDLSQFEYLKTKE